MDEALLKLLFPAGLWNTTRLHLPRRNNHENQNTSSSPGSCMLAAPRPFGGDAAAEGLSLVC